MFEIEFDWLLTKKEKEIRWGVQVREIWAFLPLLEFISLKRASIFYDWANNLNFETEIKIFKFRLRIYKIWLLLQHFMQKWTNILKRELLNTYIENLRKYVTFKLKDFISPYTIKPTFNEISDLKNV